MLYKNKYHTVNNDILVPWLHRVARHHGWCMCCYNQESCSCFPLHRSITMMHRKWCTRSIFLYCSTTKPFSSCCSRRSVCSIQVPRLPIAIDAHKQKWTSTIPHSFRLVQFVSREFEFVASEETWRSTTGTCYLGLDVSFSIVARGVARQLCIPHTTYLPMCRAASQTWDHSSLSRFQW